MNLSLLNGTPNPGRRMLLKGGTAAGALTLAHEGLMPRPSSAQTATPHLDPFIDPLPIPPIARPTVLSPPPGRLPVTGEAGRAEHQRFEEFYPEVQYEIHVKETKYRYHSQLPQETVWAYNGSIPGPTFIARAGVPAIVRFRNELPETHVGYGSPEISIHLHSGHVGPASDGFASDYYSAYKAGPTLSRPGAFLDYHYPNFPPNKDFREITGTLWYHDHREDYTAANVYRGLAGFYLGFDALDTGDETTGLKLPAGVGRYDIPLLLQDKRFDSGGNLFFDQLSPEGFLGNHFLVNGKVQPYFKVEGRKYRFRLLNGSMARYFEMYLADAGDRDQPFTFIGSDGNLLERPLTLKKILLGMAERADIIIDFSRFAPGTRLYLVNRMRQDDPRKPELQQLRPGIRMLRFEVGDKTEDRSVIPAFLRPLSPAPFNGSTRKRSWTFERTNGQWAINGKFFDHDRIDARPQQDVAEIWRMETKGGWAHPVHVHLDDFRILSYNGKPPPPEWAGRKDTISLLPGVTAEILVEFRDFNGRYMMHCHHHMHEDHAMMIRFDIQPTKP
ncbi:multicopper oxidase family protein [Massilia suwonensis]|uniref:Multicopper oxidase CueO n=1 Tax=Massilia suwonensis TaxID=648895 RepID=A0ABW0MFP5_9BURK